MALKPPTKVSWDAEQRKAFGTKIREARQTKYSSQEQFAEALGKAAPYVSQIESGKRIPSDELCVAMSDLLPEACDWAAIRIEAHRLRSPLEIASLVEKPSVTAEIAKDPAFQRLWLALQQTTLPRERRDTLLRSWLQELRIIRDRLNDEARTRRVKRDADRVARGSR